MAHVHVFCFPLALSHALCVCMVVHALNCSNLSENVLEKKPVLRCGHELIYLCTYTDEPILASLKLNKRISQIFFVILLC